MVTAVKGAFDLLLDDIVELSTENESLKNKIGFYDAKCSEESKAKLLKQIDDAKNFYLWPERKTDEKSLKKWHVYLLTTYRNKKLITSFSKRIKCKISTLNN